MKKFAVLVAALFVIVACYVPTVLPAPTATVFPTVLPTVTKLPTVTQEPVANSWTAKITLPTVNVRNSPGGSVIGSVTVGSTVEIVACVDSWCEIVEPSGYVWRGCLSDNPDGLGCSSK